MKQLTFPFVPRWLPIHEVELREGLRIEYRPYPDRIEKGVLKATADGRFYVQYEKTGPTLSFSQESLRKTPSGLVFAEVVFGTIRP